MSRRLLVHDGHAERELLLVGTMAVGRDPRCDISDADPLLSRRHAEFITDRATVRVRNLQSRNGVEVNGVNVTDAVLHPGDVIRIANLTMRYVADEDTVTPTRISAADADGDADKTVLVPPPVAPGGGPSAAAERPQPAGEEEDDATRLVAPPAAGRRDRVEARPMRRPPSAAPKRPQPVPQPAGRPSQKPRTAWSTRITVRVVALATGVFLLAAVPLWVWQQGVMNRAAVVRAPAMAQWLAADAAAADEAGVIQDAANAVGREPGVVAALVLGPEGQVLSPSARAAEAFRTIPGIPVAVPDIGRLRAGWNGSLVEVAAPVVSRRRGRVGVAWVTVHPPSLPDAGAGAVVILAPALLIALAAGFGVAVSIRRVTDAGVKALNQDIELALSGHVASVVDTLGSRPLRDLTDTLNYLITRLRYESDEGAKAAEAPPPASDAAPPSGYQRARIVSDGAFRVSEASPGCLDLLGLKPAALVGQHLLDGLSDGAIGDAMLKCLADVQPGSDAHAVVPGRGLRVSVARPVKDGPVTITFTRDHSVMPT